MGRLASAASIVADVTDETREHVIGGIEPEPDNPAQVRGGQKGGPARAAKLTAEQRSEIARRAARARWASDDASSG